MTTKKILKTYILRDGRMLGYPFTVGDKVVRVLFSGSTPYNERMCGTFQTDNVRLQQAMENSKMFNNVYDLWLSSSDEEAAPVAAEAPEAPEAPAAPAAAAAAAAPAAEAPAALDAPAADATASLALAAAATAAPAAAAAAALPKVEVSSWPEAKMLLVERYGVSKLTRSDAESLQRHAEGFGFQFEIVSKE